MVIAPTRNALDRMAGKWTMHTYIGDRVFDDRLELSPDAQGELKGTVSVPGGFTAPVEHLKGSDETRFSFEIRPDEGQGPFRVAYRAELDPTADVFVGFATFAEDGRLLGAFVGEKDR